MQIRAVMTEFPHSVGLDQTLKVARELMFKHHIRHLPVQHGGELIGIITERDINFALSMDRANPEDLKVEDAHTADLYLVSPDESVKTIAAHMAKEGLGCALVVEDEKLVGIFTTVDACRTLADVL